MSQHVPPAAQGIQLKDLPIMIPTSQSALRIPTPQVPNCAADSLDPAKNDFLVPEFVHQRRPPGCSATNDISTVDIVAVPAVGGNPYSTWQPPFKDSHLTRFESSESGEGISSNSAVKELFKAGLKVPSWKARPWVLEDIPNAIDRARVLLYSHGIPQGLCTFDSLAANLLEKILDERKTEVQKKRPLFFLGHSTGGLVIKAALIKAQRQGLYNVVGDNCYGVAFFATPHQGSSYLSSPIYSRIVQVALGLQRSMPVSLQEEIKVKSEKLAEMAREWMPVAAELHIWTFYETFDTNLTDVKLPEHERVSFQAPLTSIKSAILELHHEVDRPVLANHADCAALGPDNEYTKRSFIEKLALAADQAQKLSLVPHTKIVIENKVDVEVHGFYESAEHRTFNKEKKKQVRLWSTTNSLDIFMKHGPAKCLQDRLQETILPPTRHQMINASSSRRSSFVLDPNTKSAPSSNVPKPSAKAETSKVAKKPSVPKLRNLQELVYRRKEPAGTGLTTNTLAAPQASIRRMSLPSMSPTSTSVANSSLAPMSTMPQPARQAPDIHTGMPSLLVSEHDEEAELSLTQTLSLSIIRDQDTSTSQDARELRPPLRKHPTSESLTSASERNCLTPLTVPRTTLHPIILTPADTPYSDDSGTESNHSNNGEASAAGPPTRPDPESQKFVWIHLAYNNPTWVSDVFAAISEERKQNFNEVLLADSTWCKRHIRGRNTHYHACYIKSGCLLLDPELKPPSEPPTPNPTSREDFKMALYLPYLHWDTYRRMVKRRNVVKARLMQGRSRPTPASIESMDDELQVAWKYLGHDPPFHTRRTLDQFGYPNLSDTRARDDDQMLYKMTKHPSRDKQKISETSKTSAEDGDVNVAAQGNNIKAGNTNQDAIKDDSEDLKDGKVLLVDQIWLWILDPGTIITFFPKRQAMSLEGKLYQQADLRNSIYNEVNADLSRQCENSLDLAALVALHAVTLMFERASHHDLEIFRIFEWAISILIENLTSSFKFFRAKGFQAVNDDDDSDDDAEAIRQHHRDEGRKFQNQVQQNVSALLELRDISDELQTLKKLFEEQTEAINQTLQNYERCGYGQINGCGFLHEAQLKLKDYLHRITEMMESTERTRDGFVKLLDMVQRQANVDEARRARWQIDLQQKQSRAIFIFTVFTIFFLPLSFFTGVFGMNTVEWGGTGGKMVSLKMIGKIALPVSFAIFGSALTLALSTPIWRRVKYAATLPFHPSEKIQVSVPGTLTTQTKRRLRRFRKANQNTDDYREADFWLLNRENPEDKYRIPAQNKETEEQVGGTSRSRGSSHRSRSGTDKSEKRKQDPTTLPSVNGHV